jgi:hypothetical protein
MPESHHHCTVRMLRFVCRTYGRTDMRDSAIWMLVVAAICVVPSRAALSQDPPPKENGQGYVFAGLGAANTTGTFHVGIGGERRIFSGFGVGAEIGGMVALRSMEDGLAMFSVNGIYTFNRKAAGRVRPFMTAGYTSASLDGGVNAINFGGGVHYWFSRRFGARLEFRDHILTGYTDRHLWEGRLGLAFR